MGGRAISLMSVVDVRSRCPVVPVLSPCLMGTCLMVSDRLNCPVSQAKNQGGDRVPQPGCKEVLGRDR